ncbi:hypothetical protein AB8E32_14820 [Marinomonas polaris]|uniref:hypothetical protein n=1 Tax=Marinomonas polaris TaxID=293552 RepID=UPI003512B929
MSMFDLKRKSSNPTYPDWIKNDNERSVYDAVNGRIKEIETLVESSFEPLSAKEKKITKSVICIDLGLSGSYIAKHSELNNYVDGHQRRVSRLSEGLKTVKQQADSNKARPEAMNKPELVAEVKALRERLKERESELYVDQLKHLLDSGLAESQVLVKRRISQLEEELEASRTRMAKVNAAFTILKGEVVSAYRINKTKTESVLSLLGSATDPEDIVSIIKASSKKADD